MHVLHKRREKHLGELVVAEEKEIFPASAASDGTLRNAHRLADELRVPANENKRSGGEEEGVVPAWDAEEVNEPIPAGENLRGLR